MIGCENRALSEWIRDRCERTGIGGELCNVEQIKSAPNLLLRYPFTVLLVRALIHEFARVSRVIIHGAV